MCLFLTRSSPLAVASGKSLKWRIRLKMTFSDSAAAAPRVSTRWKCHGSSENLSAAQSSECTSNRRRLSSLTLRLAFGLALPVVFFASARRKKALEDNYEEEDFLFPPNVDRVEAVFASQTKIPPPSLSTTQPRVRQPTTTSSTALSSSQRRLPLSASFDNSSRSNTTLASNSRIDEPDSRNVQRPPRIRPASRTTSIGHLRPTGSFEIHPSSLLSARQPLTYRGVQEAAAASTKQDSQQKQKSSQHRVSHNHAGAAPVHQQQHRSSSPNGGVDGRSLFTRDPFTNEPTAVRATKRNPVVVEAPQPTAAGRGVRCDLQHGGELEFRHERMALKTVSSRMTGAAAGSVVPTATSTPNDVDGSHQRVRSRFNFATRVSTFTLGQNVSTVAQNKPKEFEKPETAAEAAAKDAVDESFNSVVTSSQDTSQSFSETADLWNTARDETAASEQATAVENTNTVDLGGSYEGGLGGGQGWNTVAEDEDETTLEAVEDEEDAATVENNTVVTDEVEGGQQNVGWGVGASEEVLDNYEQPQDNGWGVANEEVQDNNVEENAGGWGQDPISGEVQGEGQENGAGWGCDANGGQVLEGGNEAWGCDPSGGVGQDENPVNAGWGCDANEVVQNDDNVVTSGWGQDPNEEVQDEGNAVTSIWGQDPNEEVQGEVNADMAGWGQDANEEVQNNGDENGDSAGWGGDPNDDPNSGIDQDDGQDDENAADDQELGNPEGGWGAATTSSDSSVNGWGAVAGDDNNEDGGEVSVEPAEEEEEEDTAYHTATEVDERDNSGGDAGGGWGGGNIQNVDGSNDLTTDESANNNTDLTDNNAESNLESGLWGTVDQSGGGGGDSATSQSETGEWGTVDHGDTASAKLTGTELHECMLCEVKLPRNPKSVADHCVEHDCTLEEYLDAAEMTESDLFGKPLKTSSPAKDGGKKESVCVVDFYQDDDLNGDDPNLQLQIVHEAGDEEEEGKGDRKNKPMLMDSESILSMDLNSTGPTSLRSNATEDDDTDNNADDRDLDDNDDEEKTVMADEDADADGHGQAEN